MPPPPDPTTPPLAAGRSGPRRGGWPRRCACCLQWGTRALCNDCVARFAAPVPRCRQCALPLAAPVGRCGACLAHPPSFDHAVVAADYGFPWDRLLARFKFEQQPELAGPLASLLGDAVRLAVATTALPLPDLLVPVPLSAQRLAERGYNQAWELARRVARDLRLPASPRLLERWRDSPHQVGAGRAQRLANLRGAMAVDPLHAPRLAGRRVALVDDVLTTGITAQVSAQALRDAGAASVQVWVVARTPAPEHPGAT